jgi:flavin-dependent dehydrogenase
LAIASIPYGYVQNRSIGLWCIGDQAAVIPSFSGDGIAIALHSARWAPNAIWQAKRVPNSLGKRRYWSGSTGDLD